MLVSKYTDHLPLYRQAQIYKRQGIEIDRSTLVKWVGRAAWHMRPVHQRLLEHLKASHKLFADETTPRFSIRARQDEHGPAMGLCPRRSTKAGRRSAGVAHVYAPDRKAERPMTHLGGFTAILQVDVCGGPSSKCKRNITSVQACGRVLTCARPWRATSTRRGPLWKNSIRLRVLWGIINLLIVPILSLADCP
ncbi:IS66 family transposase [Ensifer aridi]|uniref:IS66 family transposase n=1 Tax=Ensifer aridi TaxID=1708715 RepID=UPI000A11C3FB